MAMLLIDTSASEAVLRLYDQETLMAEKKWSNSPELGKRLLREIDGFVQQNIPITRIAVNAGPGGYSSLRIGVITATLLAYAWNIDLSESGQQEAVSLIRPRYS
jgi:tRNA A37 threonylcarbamoyladenosine modification protein TsaB